MWYFHYFKASRRYSILVFFPSFTAQMNDRINVKNVAANSDEKMPLQHTCVHTNDDSAPMMAMKMIGPPLSPPAMERFRSQSKIARIRNSQLLVPTVTLISRIKYQCEVCAHLDAVLEATFFTACFSE